MENTANNIEYAKRLRELEKRRLKNFTKASVESMTNRGQGLPETLRESEEINEEIRKLKELMGKSESWKEFKTYTA